MAEPVPLEPPVLQDRPGESPYIEQGVMFVGASQKAQSVLGLCGVIRDWWCGRGIDTQYICHSGRVEEHGGGNTTFMCVVPPDVLYWTHQGQPPRLSSARVPQNFGAHGNMCMLVRRGVSPQTTDTLPLHRWRSETAFSVLPYVREVGISHGAVGVQTASAFGSATWLC